jgi:hypothetical protein
MGLIESHIFTNSRLKLLILLECAKVRQTPQYYRHFVKKEYFSGIRELLLNL